MYGLPNNSKIASFPCKSCWIEILLKRKYGMCVLHQAPFHVQKTKKVSWIINLPRNKVIRKRPGFRSCQIIGLQSLISAILLMIKKIIDLCNLNSIPCKVLHFKRLCEKIILHYARSKTSLLFKTVLFSYVWTNHNLIKLLKVL